MRRNLPPYRPFLGKSVPPYPHVIREYIDSGNNGHVFRAVDGSTGSELAFKIVPVANLPGGADNRSYLAEATKANSLQHDSVVKCINAAKYTDPENAIDCIVFVYNYVKGKSLRRYMTTHKSEIDITFIEGFLRMMFELLFELQQRGYEHGDLHSGNVLVAERDYDLYDRVVFRVTDFGTRELTAPSEHAGDYLALAHMLRELLRCIEYRDCDGRDRYVYDVLRHEFLGRHLIETNALADPMACNPRRLARKLDGFDDEYRERKRPVAAKLVTPFDYPSCEQIGESDLLLQTLYSDRVLGLSEIQARSNLVLTGPRGCGKTTVFRALSLKYLASVGQERPEDVKYVGVYYRCDDLYFSFPRYCCPDRPEALNVPMHFVVCTLLAMMLRQVGAWAAKYFGAEFRKKRETLVKELWQALDLRGPGNPTANAIETLAERLAGKERRRAGKKQLFVHVSDEPIDGYFGPEKLFAVCELIRKRLSFLRERPFYFFVDDYSLPKISADLQANLNRLFMHRSPDVFFKLSTESPVSFVRSDVDGKQFVETREYDLLNLGLRYLTDKTGQTRAFLEDMFRRRFGEVEGYPVQSLEELVGTVPRNENAAARAFREERDARSRGDADNYAGCETVAAMCSGDIHDMIRLVSRMVEDCGGVGGLERLTSRPKVSVEKQHRSIRATAGAFMEAMRNLPRWGPRLAAVVTAFGSVARSLLLYETAGNEAGSPPHQASRIEPYDALDLSTEAKEVLNALLRYSVLIEDPRGMSRRGKVVPRFYLRRCLIPHFRLTFSRRDSLALENRELESLFCQPEAFQESMRLRSADDARRRRRKRKNQEELF